MTVDWLILHVPRDYVLPSKLLATIHAPSRAVARFLAERRWPHRWLDIISGPDWRAMSKQEQNAALGIFPRKQEPKGAKLPQRRPPPPTVRPK